MSDRIMVMHEGRVSGEFDAKEANQELLLACAVGKKINEDAAWVLKPWANNWSSQRKTINQQRVADWSQVIDCFDLPWLLSFS